MLGFLKRLWRGDASRRRAIFRYFNGSETTWADPFQITRDLEKHGGKNWMALLSGLSLGGVPLEKMEPNVRQSAIDNFHHSVSEVANLVRLAFRCHYLQASGGKPIGLSDGEAIDLLGEFVTFLNGLEEEFRPLLSPPVAESQSAEDDLTTGPLLDSRETETGCEENSAMTSPEESASPSERSESPQAEWITDEDEPTTIRIVE